jgi:CRISPR system Cascade subunit CasA
MYGLREVLQDAHEITEISDSSPVVTICLHRLLLAILHRCFGPKNLLAWRQLWEAALFDMRRLDEYFERWQSRFDLFDTEHPFFQTAGMSTDKPLPAVSLFDEISCNNNPTLFEHASNEPPRPLTRDAVARGLIARQAFALGLGVSPKVTIKGKEFATGMRKDGPLARGLFVLLRGDNLFETLLCNLTEYGNSDDDVPIWEQDDSEDMVGAPSVLGRLDLYTFQSRRLRLVPPQAESMPLVERIHFAQGRALARDEGDPMKPYSREKKRGWVAFRLKEEKAVWRDSSALLELAQDPDRPIPALNWIARASQEGIVDRRKTCMLDVLGAATKPGKATSLILWRHERIPLPLEYLTDKALVSEIKVALHLAEYCGKALREAGYRTAQYLLKPDAPEKADQDRVRTYVESLSIERSFWPCLDVAFRRLLVDLPGDSSLGHLAHKRREWFCGVLRPAAQRAFRGRTGHLDQTGRALRAVAIGETHLGRALGRIARSHNIDCKRERTGGGE